MSVREAEEGEKKMTYAPDPVDGGRNRVLGVFGRVTNPENDRHRLQSSSRRVDKVDVDLYLNLLLDYDDRNALQLHRTIADKP